MKNADWPSRLFDAALAAFFSALLRLLCFWLMACACLTRCPCARRTLWAC